MFGGENGPLDSHSLVDFNPLVRVELRRVECGRITRWALGPGRLDEPVGGGAAWVSVLDKARHVEVGQCHDLAGLIPQLWCGGLWDGRRRAARSRGSCRCTRCRMCPGHHVGTAIHHSQRCVGPVGGRHGGIAHHIVHQSSRNTAPGVICTLLQSETDPIASRHKCPGRRCVRTAEHNATVRRQAWILHAWAATARNHHARRRHSVRIPGAVPESVHLIPESVKAGRTAA
mmetsp:Transcript_4882/g.12584  ORF Transcript_4882/g.12584 Transcript_4882/m.12584 type:complete len:230 (-) Transcript_4882:91-780(-)